MRRTLIAIALMLLASAGAAAIATGDGDARIKAGQFTVAGFSHADGYAKCGKRMRAVGGGAIQSGPPHSVQLHASGPLDATGVTLDTNSGDIAKQWYASVVNGSNVERTVRVFALCSRESKATIRAAQFTVGNFDHGEAYARCGSGKRALGGGVVQSGAPNSGGCAARGPLDASGNALDTETGDVAKQWYAAVHIFDNETTLRVFAICAPESRARLKESLFIVNDQETGEGFARCGRGRRVVGGGVVPLGSPENVRVRASGPLDASGNALNTGERAKRWYGASFNNSGFQRVVRVFAICE